MSLKGSPRRDLWAFGFAGLGISVSAVSAEVCLACGAAAPHRRRRDTVSLANGLILTLEMRRETSRVSFLMCPLCGRGMLLT